VRAEESLASVERSLVRAEESLASVERSLVRVERSTLFSKAGS